MKHYSYFPGCSSEATGVAYGISTQAICEPLEMELSELEDWNCCGSTPYGSTDELEAVCIATRNLAIAEEKGLDLVTPCSSCYLTLNMANSNLKLYPELKDNVDRILAAAGLKYRGTIRVRHLAEAILNDIGLEAIGSRVVNSLDGLKVAPYYGCQLVRPELGFDDPENPQSLDRLIASLGAEPTPFPLKSRCCGGSLMISEPDIALGLVRKLLESASDNGAECIIAACPLCQTNLDVYQGMVNARFKTRFEIPVLFFTQLMGLAFGINGKALGLDKGVISAKRVLKPFQVVAK